MASKDDKYIKTFDQRVTESLSRIEQGNANIELYIERRVEQEREKNSLLFAPYMAWTVLLGILGLFGVAIVTKLVAVIGL